MLMTVEGASRPHREQRRTVTTLQRGTTANSTSRGVLSISRIARAMSGTRKHARRLCENELYEVGDLLPRSLELHP